MASEAQPSVASEMKNQYRKVVQPAENEVKCQKNRRAVQMRVQQGLLVQLLGNEAPEEA